MYTYATDKHEVVPDCEVEGTFLIALNLFFN